MTNRRQFTSSLALMSATGLLPSLARAQSTDPLHFGLKPGKPYAGTEVTIMLPNAAQYRAQRKRLGQLEELTGIKAIHSYVPYGQLLDKITTEAVSRSASPWPHIATCRRAVALSPCICARSASA
mgnify:CR=1 FL=1